MSSETKDAFIKSILETPDDDFPRLVYADWLEEQGDPLGEFIRLQCEYEQRCNEIPVLKYSWPGAPLRRNWSDEKLNSIRERLTKLESQYRDDWVDESTKGLKLRSPMFSRGMIHRVNMTLLQFCRNYEKVFAQMPLVRSLDLELIANKPAQMHGVELLNRIETLRVSQKRAGDELRTILRSEHLTNLKRLQLAGMGLRWYGVETALKNSKVYPSQNLEWLNLNSNVMGVGGVEFLMKSTFIPTLEVLNLDNDDFKAQGAMELANQPDLANLKALTLRYDRIGNVGVAAIAKAEHFQNLQVLDLGNNLVGDSGAKALLDSPWLNNLQYISLTGNKIKPHLIEELKAKYGGDVLM